jgi:hypothetical protein
MLDSMLDSKPVSTRVRNAVKGHTSSESIGKDGPTSKPKTKRGRSPETVTQKMHKKPPKALDTSFEGRKRRKP